MSCTIEPNSLRMILKGWRRGQQAPRQWLALQIAHHATADSPADRDVILYYAVRDLVESQLRVCRNIAGYRIYPFVDSDLEVIRTAFIQDMQPALTAPSELCLWSAVYYRYIISVTLSQQYLADQAALSPRTVSRYTKQGLQLLAYHLHRREQRHKIYATSVLPTFGHDAQDTTFIRQ